MDYELTEKKQRTTKNSYDLLLLLLLLFLVTIHFIEGVKMSTAQQEPTVAGQRNIEVLCEKVHAHLP